MSALGMWVLCHPLVAFGVPIMFALLMWRYQRSLR